MGVTEIIVVGQRNGRKGNSLAGGIHSLVRDVRARETMEEIVGRAVFLKDHNDILNFLREQVRR
jgi:hypothetical protein